MPDLNLNEEGAFEEQKPSEEPSQPEATEEPRHAGGGQATRIIIILVVLGVLVGAAYMLNKLGIVKLWGPKEPVVAVVQEPQAQEQAPQEAANQPPQEQAQQPAQQPAKEEPKATPPQVTQASKEQPKEEVKQAVKQESKPAEQTAEMKPVETPAIETKPKVAAQEPAKMPFRLLDPISFPSRQRAGRPIVKQEAPVEQPQQPQQPQQKEQVAAATPKQETTPEPKQQVVEQPKQQEPAQPKMEMKAQQPKQETATPKKETTAQVTQPKQTAPTSQPKEVAKQTAKVEVPAKPKQEMPKAETAKVADMKGTYTVQVYALRDKANADAVALRLNEAGYPAFVEEIPAKDMTWYTVRIGKYPSAAEAKKAVDSFAQEIKMHHFIDKVRTKEN